MSEYPLHLLGVVGPTPDLPVGAALDAALNWDAIWQAMAGAQDVFITELPKEQDQADAGSCVPNATAFAEEHLTFKKKKRRVQVSRLYVYRKGREIRGWENQDSGLNLGDAATVYANGVCFEYTFGPYATRRIFEPAPSRAILEASFNKARQLQVPGGALGIAATLLGQNSAFADGERRIVWDGHPVNSDFFDLTGKDGYERGVKPGDRILGYHCRGYIGINRGSRTVPGFKPGGFWRINQWRNWGIAHPDPVELENLGLPYGVSLCPFELADDPNYSFDAHAPLEALPVE